MRLPSLVAHEVMTELQMTSTAQHTAIQDPENPNRWLFTFESLPNSLVRSRLHIEVMQGETYPFACVLERQNVGYSALNRIMSKLMDRLEEPRAYRPSGQSPPGGEPAPS
jgi:hypothetical protein